MKRHIESEEEKGLALIPKTPLQRIRAVEPINFKEILLGIDVSHKTVLQQLKASGK